MEDVALNGDSVRTLQLEVYGRGLELIQQYQRLKKFELSVYPGRYPDSSLVKIQDIQSDFSVQVLPRLQLIRFYPDSFHFRYRKLYGKNVAIQPDFKLNFENGYGQTGPIKFLPDSIRVFSFQPNPSWPKGIRLEPKQFDKLKSSLRTSCKLIPPTDSLVFVRKHQVLVELPVHRITEGKLQLPIRLIPAVPGIRLVPATVEISFEAALHHYKQIGSANFEVLAYWQERTASGHLPVHVSCSQAEVLRFKVFPKQIDYILP